MEIRKTIPEDTRLCIRRRGEVELMKVSKDESWADGFFDALRERKEAEQQREVVNQSFAEIRRKTINKSLRTLYELVEKKQ